MYIRFDKDIKIIEKRCFMYEFVVSFVGEVPQQFEFIYSILTLILSITIFGTFSSLFYFVLRLVRGVH